MKSKFYKYCVVPQCKNTTIKTPEKLFIHVPRTKNVRKKWLELARRGPGLLATKSKMYFCEDHFDLPNDMENYMKYRLMGAISQVKIKAGHFPTKFECQPDRRRLTDTKTTSLPVAQRLEYEREIKNVQTIQSILTEVQPDPRSDSSCGNFYTWQGCYLGDHTYAAMRFPQPREAEMNYRLQCTDSPEMKYIKEEIEEELKQEPLWMDGEECCESQAETSLDTDITVKDEPVQSEMKEQSDSVECGVSDAAMMAGLYTDHAVKDEIVLGPEFPHKPDVMLAVRSWAIHSEDWSTTMLPCDERTNLKDCSVSLDRLPHRQISFDARCTQDSECGSNKKYMSRPSICALCGEGFKMKSELMRHVLRHSQGPAKLGQGLRVSNKEKNKSPIRDCWVTVERCDPADYIIKTSIPKTERKTSPTHDTELHENTEKSAIATTETKNYVCNTCGESFQQKHDLIGHFRLHAEKSLVNKKYETDIDSARNTINKKRFACRFCNKVFRLNRDLIRHENRHTGEKPYSCAICKKAYAREDYIKLHTQLVHNNVERKFSCDICHMKFKRLVYLQRHKLVHSAVKLHSCKICNKAFKGLDSLRRHLKIHLGERKYQCTICNMRFALMQTLNIHQRVHTGDKPYSCEICEKSYAHLQALTNHKRTHTGERPYACSICNKRFSGLINLKSHKLIHEGVKRYHCEICKKSFMHMCTLTRHKLIHIGEKKHVCQICNKRFLLRDHLKQHIPTHNTEKPYTCDICNRGFVSIDYLCRHRRVHGRDNSYSCEQCQITYSNWVSLANHNRIHRRKPFSCDICKKLFKQKSYLVAHIRAHDRNINNK